jgi:magnesium-dependent phosphatase 1
MYTIQNDPFIDTTLVNKWQSLRKKPTVIVFDLDYTLWPYFIEHHVTAPIHKTSSKVVDSKGFTLTTFADVNRILKTLKEKCLGPHQHLAIASRSITPELAMNAIELLGWKDYFSSIQIYPTPKSRHMNKIQEELRLAGFQEVLFFDDDQRNIVATRPMGVCAIQVDQSSGLTMEMMMIGLDRFDE